MDVSKPERKQEFLLDTGVFYALSKPQVEMLLNNKHRIHLSSGVMVPFELISGIPSSESPDAERQFRSRQAALSKYEKLIGVTGTYWDAPSIIRQKAFGFPVLRQSNTSLQILIKACIECNSITELETVIKAAQVLSASMPSLDWFRQQADTVSQAFRNSFDSGKQSIEKVTESQLPKDEERSMKEQRKIIRGFIPYLYQVGDIHTQIFLALAEAAGAWNGQLSGADLYEECIKVSQQLKERYDGSIDLYITALAAYWTEKWLDGSGPHRNDSFDLDHIVYLRKNDPNQVFVTTDNSLGSRCIHAAPERAVSINAFLDRVNS